MVTGANRGIGRHFATQLLERGASKVYATARRPELVDLPGAEVLQLDITSPESLALAAAAAPDVSILINNAGIATNSNLVSGDLDLIRLEMETHYFGTLNAVRAFAPVLAKNGGGAMLNVLSSLSWFSYDGSNSYSAAKAAQWSLTNGVRLELAKQGTLVTGVHLGAADTDICLDYEGAKIDPADAARAGLDGIENGLIEVLVDDWSATVKATLSRDPGEFYKQVVSGA